MTHYFHLLVSPQKTMGNLPCNTEHCIERNTHIVSDNPDETSTPSRTSFKQIPELPEDFENNKLSNALFSSNKSSSQLSNSVTSTKQLQQGNHQNIKVNNMESNHFDAEPDLIRQHRLVAVESSNIIAHKSEERRYKPSDSSDNMEPYLSREMLQDLATYPILHSQNIEQTDDEKDPPLHIRNTDCNTSNTPLKEWVPFYSSYFSYPIANSVRWSPYAVSFEALKSNDHSRCAYPSEMMQSLPSTAMSTSLDRNNSCEIHSTINHRPELLMSKNSNQNACRQKLEMQQNFDWIQGKMIMSSEPSFMNTPFTPPFWRNANPTDATFHKQENNTNVMNQLMSSYTLRSLSPSKGIKREESPLKPTKRSHESCEAQPLIASSPLRMYVKSSQENHIKDEKGQRIFSRPRRGRQSVCNQNRWPTRDERIKSNNDVKKSRSSELPDSNLNFEGGVMTTRESSPPPTFRTISGKRVVMVDVERKVFIIDLLSSDDCDIIRKMTDDYVRGVYDSHSGAATWRTLYTYTKQDLPCGEVPGLTNRFTNRIMSEVIKIVGEIYCQPKEAAKLRPRSWKEPHLLLYQRIENKPIHTGVEMHYDGCDITWNCMLSKPSEYEGGGTYIRCLKKTIMLNQGQVLVHPGELYHKGVDITKGVRSLIVCFMDGFNPKMTDDSHARDDKVVYELNVRRY